jgi:hypothetical protein
LFGPSQDDHVTTVARPVRFWRSSGCHIFVPCVQQRSGCDRRKPTGNGQRVLQTGRSLARDRP